MQDIIVYLVVSGSALYLGRTVYAALIGKKSCGCGTGGCGAKKPVAQPELIQISLGRKK